MPYEYYLVPTNGSFNADDLELMHVYLSSVEVAHHWVQSDEVYGPWVIFNDVDEKKRRVPALEVAANSVARRHAMVGLGTDEILISSVLDDSDRHLVTIVEWALSQLPARLIDLTGASCKPREMLTEGDVTHPPQARGINEADLLRWWSETPESESDGASLDGPLIHSFLVLYNAARDALKRTPTPSAEDLLAQGAAVLVDFMQISPFSGGNERVVQMLLGELWRAASGFPPLVIPEAEVVALAGAADDEDSARRFLLAKMRERVQCFCGAAAERVEESPSLTDGYECGNCGVAIRIEWHALGKWA